MFYIAEGADKNVSVRMPQDLWDALDALAAENERPPSAEIRLALKNWVKSEAIKDRNGGS